MTFLGSDIEFLKGVGPARANLLHRELEVFSYEDLLLYFPFRYVDRSVTLHIDNIKADDSYVVLQGKIFAINQITSGRTSRLNALFTDGTGIIELVWFQGIKWVKDSLKENAEYRVMGRPSLFNGRFNIAHPELEIITDSGEQPRHGLIPVYSSSEKLKSKGLNSKGIGKLTELLLFQGKGKIPEVLPYDVVSQFKLMSRETALNNIHFPQSPQDITAAIRRMKFEELFFLQLDYQYAKIQRQRKNNGFVFSVVGEHFNRFYWEKLPFSLTGAQKRVIKEIREDMRSGHQMNRLVQGDVGSGKTLVALLCMLIALDNGCQTCMMAPTEILASQHATTISRMLEGLNINVELLTGSLKLSQKKKIKERLANGEIDILIGTHALIEDNVQFKNLGFVVIDEQHRFGVEQRAKLWTKNTPPPHMLVMTATPIPRTLAMTVYGDLDCSIIDELPPGRKPIQTIHGTDASRPKVYHFLHQEIAKGRQVYIVYPLINESEKLDIKDLMDGYDCIAREFPLPQYQISIVHGQMDAATKEYEMDRFKRGITNIMVSTTVIEVGVDVPNASVMMIENAERFGLSQLHQLRGRVGRGSDQSYCILMTKNDLKGNTLKRIRTMVDSNDGFRIAEADLKLRGPGDMQGLQQSGLLQLKLADLINDEPIVQAARESVRTILDKDPNLLLDKNACLQLYLRKKAQKMDWGKIS